MLSKSVGLAFAVTALLFCFASYSDLAQASVCKHFCTVRPRNVIFGPEWRQSQSLAQVVIATQYYHRLREALKYDKDANQRAQFILTIAADGELVESVCIFKHSRCKLNPKPGLMLPVPPSNLINSFSNTLDIEVDL